MTSNTEQPPGIPLAPRCPASTLPSFRGSSSVLITSSLPLHEPVRWGYLRLGPTVSPPPLLSASPWVPFVMIEHLMRNKKDRAIAVKFSDITGRDAVTNMEGAMHTFVNPLVRVNMHGEYFFSGGHGVEEFPPAMDGKSQQARVVLLSAMIHPDFEGDKVMFKLAALGDLEVVGEDLGADFSIPTVAEKQDRASRERYDERLRRHMIKHLTAAGRLPAKSAVSPMTSKQAIEHLESLNSPLGRYVSPTQRPSAVLSLELLYYSAIQQVVNEFSALEALCPAGYVYTFDPPAIFARMLDATLLNRLYIAAVARVAALNPNGFQNMRVFGFNDYADREAVPLLRRALSAHPHIIVVPKAALFPRQVYTPPPSGVGALLVLHNNSDAFGQNIETEGDGGSMDGALGNHSSAAASLHRKHPQLVDQILNWSARMREK